MLAGLLPIADPIIYATNFYALKAAASGTGSTTIITTDQGTLLRGQCTPAQRCRRDAPIVQLELSAARARSSRRRAQAARHP
jgi:hypothetical protein